MHDPQVVTTSWSNHQARAHTIDEVHDHVHNARVPARSKQRKETNAYKSCNAFRFVFQCSKADTRTEMGCFLLAVAVVSVFGLAQAAPALIEDNNTIVLNLAFVTSNTGEFVCNGEYALFLSDTSAI